MSAPPPIEEFELVDIDCHFAKFIGRFGGEAELVETTAALLSRSVRQGHICLDLGDPLLGDVSAKGLKFPESNELRKRLSHSRAFGPPEALTPIVVSDALIYLRRYWDYEQLLAKSVLVRALVNRAPKHAAATQETTINDALENFFTIISGGPGTGKTTTVIKILERFLEKGIGGSRARVALAAPTGKAAARLQELLRTVQQDPEIDERIKANMPQHASTIHRLLGRKGDSVFFRHDRRNPLPLDLLVIDEASMVPLPLMAKIFDALPDKARVILLGDRDQLASVDPGAVLADMADAALVAKSPLQNSLFILSKNYRFGNENAIYRLSVAVRQAEEDKALSILSEKGLAELGSSELPSPAQSEGRLEQLVVEQYQAHLTENDPIKALAQFSRFRVLCALREGPYGVRQINAAVEGILHRRGLISDPLQLYPGRPILITRNDYQAQLFNGDIGIILPDSAVKGKSSQLSAWFIGPNNEPRRFSPGRLPKHELAYAMTVHKAQGSQFERVLFLLPDRDSPVLTRELIYTGVTRASKRVDVWFNGKVMRAAIGRKAMRRSGLKQALSLPQS